MNGAYHQGITPLARLSIAARGAIELYYLHHPSHRYRGMSPNYNHFESYLKPFIEKEDAISRLDERSNDDSPEGLKRRRELTQKIKDCDVEIAKVHHLHMEPRQ